MDDYRALTTAMEDEGLTDKELLALLDAVDEQKGPLRDKVDSICRLVANLGGDVEKFKMEENRLSTRRKALENKVKRLRAWVKASMDVLEVPKIETSVHTVSLGEKGKKVVVILDASLIPDEFVETTRKPKKIEILKAYEEDGVVVDGCEIKEGERSLTIR
jgi:hypothetical protein